MGETHLYSINSDGETTEVPPPGGPGDTSKRPQRAPAKARPTEPVPTDRMKFDTQVKALLTACTASRDGAEWVTADDMAALMDISVATAPLNNAFFVSVNLLEKRGKGEYRPTDITVKFKQKWTFDKKAAPGLLAPAFTDSWFFDAVQQRLALGDVTVDDMIQTLAFKANSDRNYATQFGFCLEWLEYVGLITMENGQVRLTADTPALDTAGPDSGAVDGQPTGDLEKAPPADAQDTTAQLPQRRHEDGPPPIVSMSIDITVTAEDLAKLSPEQINALFDGVGKVAAVKAALV